jgi:hypothetical protein
MKTRTLLIQQEIRDFLDILPIAGYLREEVYSAFDSMNFYKTRNLLQHKDAFAEYLIKLDKENTRVVA